MSRRSGTIRRAGGAQGSGGGSGPGSGGGGVPGQLNAFGTTMVTGTADWTTSYLLTAAGLTQVNGAASMGIAVDIAASGLTQCVGAATYDVPTSTAAGMTQVIGAVALTAEIAISATGATQCTGAADAPATIAITGTGTTQTLGSASVGRTLAIAATGTTNVTGAATFSSGASQMPPSDPLMSLLWHSELGIGLVSSEVDTWTDQIQGAVVTAPSSTNRPAYAADGANFLSRSVVQCAITGSKSLASATLTAGVLPAISTRPYWVGVVRMRSGGSARTLFSCVNSGNTTRVWAVNGNSNFLVQNPSSATSVSPAVLGTTVHFVEIWLDGTNANVRVDGVLTSTAFTGSMLDNMIKIFVGSLTGNTSLGDASWAALMCFTALPTSGYIASLRSWANGYFGSPP